MIDEADAHTEAPELKGRRAIVTGGTTGIGRAIAVLLASYGVKVFVCGRTPEHLGDALQRIREVGEGDGINVDLSVAEDVDRFFEAAPFPQRRSPTRARARRATSSRPISPPISSAPRKRRAACRRVATSS
jgi:hypothetical protein